MKYRMERYPILNTEKIDSVLWYEKETEDRE